MKSTEVMFHQSVVAAILCRNFKNPITGAVLAEQFSVDLRKIADVVREARIAGIKIASSRGGFDRFLNVELEPGYYGARRPEEIKSTAEMIHKTAMDLLHTERLLMDFKGENPTVWEQGSAA